MNDDSMMMTAGLTCHGIISLQKLLEGRSFIDLVPGLRIQSLHFFEFILCQLRQVADEVDELPTVDSVVGLTFAPGRHGGKANAVMNHPEEFAVRHGLRIGQSQVRGFRVYVLADRCPTASVIGMTGCAMVSEMREPFLQHGRAERNGIRL